MVIPTSSPSTRRSFTRTLAGLPLVHLLSAAGARKTRNIIHVMTDGLRWQEVFSGADAALINKQHGAVSNVDALNKKYWRDTPDARREALMPFLWTQIARKGQIYGNRPLGSDASVTNGKNFSYPGYNETLSGFADDRINSNDKVPNPNVTVYEWLHQKPAYRGKVAAFGAWDTFPAIFNAARAGFPVNAGHDPFTMPPVTPRLEAVNRLKAETQIWEGEALDAMTHDTALEYLRHHKPRVLYVSYGETDEWAHEGKYALYLDAAHRVDRYLAELWSTLQAMPAYRDQTSMIVSVDHGRGEAPVEWKSHGAKIPDSKYMWMAFLGPDTPALGERKNVAPVFQNQIAATMASLLGEDYNAAVPKAGKPVAAVFGS